MAQDSILVVGAGFAGSVHARTLADHGYHVDLIDRRAHIGGNAYDEQFPTGVRVHRYGPHIFHTNMEHVVTWIRQYGSFLPYEHQVEALVGADKYLPLPINRDTINAVFGITLKTEDDVVSFLRTVAVPCDFAGNAAQHLYSQIGVVLTDLFFRPYTEKMWGLTLEEMDATIVKRIPIRFDRDNRYFPNDRFQFLPECGYASVFENILDHDHLRVHLNTPFVSGMHLGYRHCFNSMAIDEYFGDVFGPLPYRSLRFEHFDEPSEYASGGAPVVNFTDARPHTRQTDWSRLPFHGGGGPRKTITLEQPCDYRENSMERYYPIKTSDGRNDATYRRYQKHAEFETNMTFIGRCGTYQYLDMHQVINQSLIGAREWLSSTP